METNFGNTTVKQSTNISKNMHQLSDTRKNLVDR